MHIFSRRLFWLVTLSSCAVSVVSAVVVEKFLSARIALVGDYIGLQRSFNTGVAFGMDFGIAEPILIATALLAVCWMALAQPQPKILDIGFGLIIGGGFANVFDRIPDGAVTDVFQVGSFPIFNVADSCITIGVFLLLLDMFLQKRD